MINRVYRLVSPKNIIVDFEEINFSSQDIIIKPTKLSICAADQRYYLGKRNESVMKKKLPMALIHEAVGEVIFDPLHEFNVGDKVVMIPNTPIEKNDSISENYLKSSKFRSSGFDGFMQDYVQMERDRIIKFENINEEIASFLELISVCIHAIDRFEKKTNLKNCIIGVWGDGNLGFIMSLILKKIYVDCEIIVFGKNIEKLNFFSFVDKVFQIDNIPESIKIDHAFELVGGKNSKYAIEQIIDIINPQGTISLLGVSEEYIEVNTRLILEKGLMLIGNSRSTREDFIKSIDLLEKDEYIRENLRKLISNVLDVSSIDDIIKAFEYDLTSTFKTIINWNI